MNSQEVAFVAYPAITQELLSAYAQASGDPNPIHLDPAAAQAHGLPGVIAHGMLTAAWIADRAQAWVAEHSGARPRWVRAQARFKSMTLLGDVISVGGTAVREGEGWKLELSARNQKGEVTTTGVCVLVAPNSSLS